MTPRHAVSPPQRHERLLAGSVAFVWLATALLVLHPTYRAIGAEWLEPLSLPAWIMFPVCAGELVLGLRLLLGPMSGWLALTQLVLVAGFTVILAALDPLLLAHPVGVLSKNLPLLAVVGCCWLLQREGWSPRASWVLRVGMAIIWVTEGLFPKILFRQPWEIDTVAASGLVPMEASHFLIVMGLAQILSGVAALLLSGRLLQLLLVAQMAALVVLPALVSWQEPSLWVHPFGPLIKNVPILVGTFVLASRCSTSS